MANNLFQKKFLKNLKTAVNKQIRYHGIFFVFFVIKKVLMRYFVSFILYIIVRLIRPIIFIRFGSLYADKIGPLVSLPVLYLCEKDHNIQVQNTLDIFHDGYGDGGNGRHICNHHLLKMWKRVFLTRRGVLVVNEIARDFLLFSMKFSLGGDHIIRTKREGRDILGLIEKSSIYLKFTREEICQAESDLKKMGIQKGEPYVCMLNRDQKYLSETFPERDWNYHSFRDCSIENYMPAAEELTKRGYYVIRMGAKVGELMETANPKIIEYEHKGFRTELLDIYLAAHCGFFIGCNSGFDAVSWLFHRPEVYVNISDLEYAHTWLSNCVLIFKKYWLKHEKRFMSVEEMIESGAGRFHRTAEYENMGIELIENTPEEILDVVDEMDMRLEGRWQTTEEDEELQARFWSYFKSSDLHGVIRARIGTKFLRQHQELLGLFSKESTWA